VNANTGNLLTRIPTQLPDELVQTLVTAPSFRVERIVSRGHASPVGFWYDQPEHEWVMLVSGAARVRFEDDAQSVAMKPGDYLHIPARRRHRVEWTEPGVDTVWLAIHYG
jgi:cupin 2 domain-containing protein